MPNLTHLRAGLCCLATAFVLAACGGGSGGGSGASGTGGLGKPDALNTNNSLPGTNTPTVLTIVPPTVTVPTAGYPWQVWTAGPVAVTPSTTGKTYYVDGSAGNDTNTGLSVGTAFKTIAKTIRLVAAGDTVLIRKGFYREGIDLNGAASGQPGKPITFGSYGDGEVILDGSPKTGVWESIGGGLWRTSKATWQSGSAVEPIAVVVNDVPLKQVTQGQGGSTAPQLGLDGVTSGSGKWHNGAQFITADMGGINPNNADIVVPKNVSDQAHVFFYDLDYITFKGLTVRGSGSNGIWGYGSNITVDSCIVKFNGKAAVSFLPSSDKPRTDNAVLYSYIYHNVLSNWPRGNNGNAEAGGGWPGTMVWSSILRPIARGNVVYMNGGEGIASYGTFQGQPSGQALIENNVVIDNWSVNIYIDNQANGVIRNNLIYNHPIDFNLATTNFLYVTTTANYPYDNMGKYSVGIGLGDETYGTDSSPSSTNLANTQVYNNIIAGARTAILDYAEGQWPNFYHGLINTVIANNTIIMPSTFPNGYVVTGIKLRDSVTSTGINRNVNSVIANNIIYGYNNDKLIRSDRAGVLDGITFKNNLYYSNAAKPFATYANGQYAEYDLAGWKTNLNAETNSVFMNPSLVNAGSFQAIGTPYDYKNADLSTTSPARGMGVAIPVVTTNFSGATRSIWNAGAF